MCFRIMNFKMITPNIFYRQFLITQKARCFTTLRARCRYSFVSIISFLFFLNATVYADNFYVAASARPGGKGTKKAPWDLQTALNQPASIKPGDIILLEKGIYKGIFISNLTGTISKPIILKNNNGARVIIDGSLAGQVKKNIPAFTIKGAYTWYYNLEVTNTDTERIINIEGSNPPERRGTGVDVFGPGVKIINFIIYDTGGGIGAWSPSQNSEYYGNIIFNNGWYATDRGHGHGIYAQNNTGTKTYTDNVILNNFGGGWQIYGSEKAQLNNFYFEGNVSFNDRWLMGGGAPLQNLTLKNNFSYRDKVQLGYSAQNNDGLVMTNNYFPGGISLFWWKNITATGNTIFEYNSLNSPVSLLFAGVPDLSTFHFNNNIYYRGKLPNSRKLSFGWTNTLLENNNPGRSGEFYLPDWKRNKQDEDLVVEYFPNKDESNVVLNGNKVFIRKNRYDATKATIIIYNWDKAATVAVNVAGILNPGDTYELRNTQNYFGDIITAKFKKGKLIVPMTGHTVAKPLGYNKELTSTTFPEFGTFILIKKPK